MVRIGRGGATEITFHLISQLLIGNGISRGRRHKKILARRIVNRILYDFKEEKEAKMIETTYGSSFHRFDLRNHLLNRR